MRGLRALALVLVLTNLLMPAKYAWAGDSASIRCEVENATNPPSRNITFVCLPKSIFSPLQVRLEATLQDSEVAPPVSTLVLIQNVQGQMQFKAEKDTQWHPFKIDHLKIVEKK